MTYEVESRTMAGEGKRNSRNEQRHGWDTARIEIRS